VTRRSGLERTAFHEAGHFVACCYLTPDHGTTQVSIVPDKKEGSAGHHSRLEGPGPVRGAGTMEDPFQYDPKEIKNYVVTLYAGAAAELRLDPSRTKEVSAGAEYDDRIAAQWLGDGVPGDHPGLGDATAEKRCRQRAATLVKKHWREIEAIAGELLVQREIDGEVACYILDLVRGNSDEKADALQGLVLRLELNKAKEILIRRVGPDAGAIIARRYAARCAERPQFG